ncbi:MAG: type II toxin-antitoxin system VapC family toxin [Candidatus Methanoperedens sp.]|nr:type II toxin-antitoxin system VapC family toxin [Candidatus Methanoperedens sp.]
MNKILVDTMWLEAIFTWEGLPTTLADELDAFADALDNEKILGISSVVSLTELTKHLGKKNEQKMRTTIQELKSSGIIFVNVTQKIAERAGELHWKYGVPTADSLIAATGMVENTKHVLTGDLRHFGPIKNLIKIIDLKQALKMVR